MSAAPEPIYTQVADKDRAVFQTGSGRTIEIRDVWASTLEIEMAQIRDLAEKYSYVAMVRNRKSKYASPPASSY